MNLSSIQKVAFPTVLFLVAFYVWSLPVATSPAPFGEGDAAWHFGVGNEISASDRTLTKLPDYIGNWYYNYNVVLGPNALEYPPSNHINYALMQVFGGEQFRPVSIYKAIVSFLGIFAVFFLVSRLYNPLVGFVAGVGLAFSWREIFTFMAGQQPSLISVVIVPAVLYCFYSYLTSLFASRTRNIYLFLTAFLMLSQYLLHIQGFIISVIVLPIFAVLMAVKYKKVPMPNFIYVGICVLVAIAIIVPFFNIYFGVELDVGDRTGLSRLFSWTIDPKLQEGSFPDNFFLFSFNYGLILLPFIMAGLAYIFLRRNDADLLLIGWILGMYLVLHFDLITGTSIPRVARMLIAEPQLLFTLAAVGAFYFGSLIKLPGDIRQLVKLGLPVVLCIILVITLAPRTVDFMKNAYNPLFRLNPSELDAALWMDKNLPLDSAVYNYGTNIAGAMYPKMRYMHMVSRRHTNDKPSGFIFTSFNLTPTHYVFDYSDIGPIAAGGDPNQPIVRAAQAQVESMQKVESSLNSTRVYDKNNIRIYEAR